MKSDSCAWTAKMVNLTAFANSSCKRTARAARRSTERDRNPSLDRLGVGAGLVAGFALSEWIGGVSPPACGGPPGGCARRPRRGSPPPPRPARSRRRSRAEPRLAGLAIEVVAVGRGVVELRGWVPTRTARTIAGRTALAAPGIESVINSILVRGEDDQALAGAPRATDQSA